MSDKTLPAWSRHQAAAAVARFHIGSMCFAWCVKSPQPLFAWYLCPLANLWYASFSPEIFIEEKATAALIGCGIGKEYNDSLDKILKSLDCPIILDADGINFISGNIDIFEHISADMIITPKEIDFVIDKMSDLISICVNKTLYDF